MTVLKLSHHTIGVLSLGTYNSNDNDCNQDNFVVKLTKLLYPALVDDLDTVCCFLKCQDTKFEPKKIQYPEVDFLSIGSEA